MSFEEVISRQYQLVAAATCLPWGDLVCTRFFPLCGTQLAVLSYKTRQTKEMFLEGEQLLCVCAQRLIEVVYPR
jgi:hypothetical protein